ncbi:hypothetical protein L1987_43219 [Smallanthus sonchifolius]|uniref:Uncharacterized protein n=1 Tax=Smallanthus sonchifolius TaxID=185202 RepID=A0ACB9GM13_9ASTR|nr:hypothetical protein L1987_43219 [Smallanthus sonchifolius]
MRKLGFLRRTGCAHLSSTHGAGPAYLPNTQEEGTAYLPSAQEEEPAYLSSTQEAGSVHLISAQASGCLGKVGQPGLAYQNKMARRGNGRRGGGRTGGSYGGHGRTPARQEYSEEGSVHTEPAVGVHGTEQTQVEEQPFTFEPEVRAAIAREFIDLMKVSLPGLLAEALKKVNETGGSNTTVDTPNTEAINAPLNRGCDYKSFKACDPPVLTGKKDAVATFDWIIRMEAAIRLSECRTDQVVKFAANSLREESSHWNEIEKVEREFLVELSGVVFDDLELNVIVIEEPKKRPSFSNKRNGGKMFGTRDKRLGWMSRLFVRSVEGSIPVNVDWDLTCASTVARQGTTPMSAHNTSSAIIVAMPVI